MQDEQSNSSPPLDNSLQNWTEVKSMQEIIPGVFLGHYISATKSHLELLLQNGITHIVCVRQDDEAHFIRPNFLDTFKYLVVELSDSVYESIIPHFTDVRKFLQECRSQGGKVLIHGNTGVSRSAALVLAHVMEEFCFTYKEAFKFVQERRFCIQPNAGFVAQLQEFEPILRARRTFQLGQSSGNQRNKRRRDHDEDLLDFIPLPPPPSPVNGQHSGSTESMDIGFCT